MYCSISFILLGISFIFICIQGIKLQKRVDELELQNNFLFRKVKEFNNYKNK